MEIYCTDTDIKDVYSNIDKFDSKILIAGFKKATGTDDLWVAYNTGLIGTLFIDGENLSSGKKSSPRDVTNWLSGAWYYNDSDDELLLKLSSDPNTKRVEGGSIWADLKRRSRENATKFVNSHLDSRLPKEMWKSRDGLYDFIIIRLTALTAAWMLIKAKAPKDPDVEVLEEEIFSTIGGLVSGDIKLSRDVTKDSSNGVIREIVSPTADNPLRLVDVRGEYSGIYDLVKVVIEGASDGGAIGTGKFTVYGGDSTGLKALKIVDAETITGNYQSIGNGVHIRFAGRDDSAVATYLDEWEIEFYGKSVEPNNTSVGSIQMTRG